MQYEYYYNRFAGEQWRNNLIYTSLISNDQTVFVQWYNNDTEYHKGQNQVVDPDVMEEKWQREIKYLSLMHGAYSNLVPQILDIDYKSKKIYLKVDGPDFWQRSLDSDCTFDKVLPDWQTQMFEIIQAHKQLGLHKYSMHPSSYFIADGQLKSINYFFTYHKDEPNISVSKVQSHIHTTRQEKMKKHLVELNVDWNAPAPWATFDRLCWESFRTNYPADFIEKCIN
jgi:hypothetical protein